MSMLNRLNKPLSVVAYCATVALLVTLSPCVTLAQSDAQADGIFTSSVETLNEQFQFTEGPVWHPDGYLLFSDIPTNKIMKWTPGPGKGTISVFLSASDRSNGLALDKEKRLIAGEHETRQVSLTQKDGTKVSIAARYEGKLLNSPNDLVVHSSGAIYFTDPPYGLQGRKQEQPCQGVYRLAPDGKLTRLIEDIKAPNGIALSPDEKLLYVADSKNNFINVYEIAGDGSLLNGRKFCDVANPDGFKVNTKGQLFIASKDGIVVFSQEGKRLATLKTPQQPANCAFGGKDYKTLFITARKGLYSVKVQAPGAATKVK